MADIRTIQHYSIRITIDEIPTIVKNTLLQKYGLTLLVREMGAETQKLHYHGLLTTDKSCATIRQYIKRQFSGNNMYSLKIVKEVNGWINYLCKEDPVDVVINIGHDIAKHHRQYLLHQEEKKEFIKEKKERMASLEDIYNDVKSILVNDPLYQRPMYCYDHEHQKDYIDTQFSKIGAAIIRHYVNNKKRLPTSFNMETMIITFQAWINEEKDDEDERKHDDIQTFQYLYPKLENRNR